MRSSHSWSGSLRRKRRSNGAKHWAGFHCDVSSSNGLKRPRQSYLARSRRFLGHDVASPPQIRRQTWCHCAASLGPSAPGGLPTQRAVPTRFTLTRGRHISATTVLALSCLAFIHGRLRGRSPRISPRLRRVLPSRSLPPAQIGTISENSCAKHSKGGAFSGSSIHSKIVAG
jgi:hypothetical protein